MERLDLRYFEAVSMVKRNGHVLVQGIDLGRVFTERYGTRQWFACTGAGERLTPTDCPTIGFRTRYQAVRALIEASEDVLSKEKPND